jgi:hypothetical protein
MLNTANNSQNTNTQGSFDLLALEHAKDPRMRRYIDHVLETHKPESSPNPNNPILLTDSYKLTQANMCGDEKFVDGKKETLLSVYASVEPRKGARDSHVVVAGVQELATQLASICVTLNDLHDAIVFLAQHFCLRIIPLNLLEITHGNMQMIQTQ